MQYTLTSHAIWASTSEIHVWDFRAQRCSPTRYTAPSWSAVMSSSVTLFMTRIFASIGFASGPSRACQVSLVTTPLSGRLAVAYTWTHLLKLPWSATAETRAQQLYEMQLQDAYFTSAIDCSCLMTNHLQSMQHDIHLLQWLLHRVGECICCCLA